MDSEQIALDCLKLAASSAPEGVQPSSIVTAARLFFRFVYDPIGTPSETVAAALDDTDVR